MNFNTKKKIQKKKEETQQKQHTRTHIISTHAQRQEI